MLTVTNAPLLPAGAPAKPGQVAPWRNLLRQAPVLLLALSLVAAGRRPPAVAPAQSEPQLIEVLQSNASPAQKDAACAQLKRLGTARCVPALAALLTDEQLADSARYVLEAMSAPEAGQALLAALGKTSGPLKASLISSLGARAEAGAVPALAKALSEPDAAVAEAAAAALGQVGTPAALQALESLPHAGVGAVPAAVADALLCCANRLLAGGEPAQARALFQRLATTQNREALQAAAFRGLVLSSADQALSLATQAILGKAGPSQTAALQLVHELAVPGAAAAFAQLLAKVEAPVQVALLEGLSQRRDSSAAPAIIALVSSPAPAVRLAAMEALGQVGDATCVPVLVQAAASARGPEQAAARQALVGLRGKPVAEALLAQLTGAQPAAQAEVARALGARCEYGAVPKLLELAREGSEDARRSAVKALAAVVDQAELGSLVQLLLETPIESARAQVAEALNAACEHIQSRRGQVHLEPLLKGLAAGSAEARIALLPICAGFNDPQVRAALRTALAEANPALRVAAVRALCATTDPELLPELVKLACAAPEQNLRLLATAGCVRLTTQEETVHLPEAQLLEPFKAILAAAPSVEQKRLLLAGLAEIPTAETFKLVQPLLGESAVQNEAARALIKIAPLLADAAQAQAALKDILARVQDGPTRQAAEMALKQAQTGAGFIRTWQVSGPIKQGGRDYRDLFDFQSPVERDGMDRAVVRWQPLACADAEHPWLMDLEKALGGGQDCAAYARTWVHCEQAQAARLELGSDDGIKVWLNDKVVHANNTTRALKPGQDQVDLSLAAGWNRLLVKVTQHNQGWGFCARLLQPDGSPLENLQFNASGPRNP